DHHLLDRAIEQPATGKYPADDQHQYTEHAGDAQPGDHRQPDAWFWPALAVATTQHAHVVASATGAKLVSRIRQTSSSKPVPAAAAAMGTRLWLVMPGTVLISSTSGPTCG